MITACGGGSGANNGNRKGDNNSGDDADGKFVSVQPLNESRCSAITEYEWRNNRCVLTSNEYVEHLELIESLPDKDRDNLVTWLGKLEKRTGFDAIFPGWSKERSDPSSENENDVLVIDGKLLPPLLEGNNFAKTNNGWAVLGQPQWHSSNYSFSSKSTKDVDNLLVEYKKAGIEMSGGDMQILVFDKVVYQFPMIEILPVDADISENMAATLHSVTLNAEYLQEADNAVLDGYDFLSLVNSALQPDEDSLYKLQSVLGVSDAFREKQMPLNTAISTPLLCRLNTGQNSTPFFSADNSSIYINDSVLSDYFEQDTLLIPAEVVLRSQVIPGAQTTKQELLHFDVEFSVSMEDSAHIGKTQKYRPAKDMSIYLEKDSVAIKDLNTATPYDALTELDKRIKAMRKSADKNFIATSAWPAYPDFSTSSITVLPLAESAISLNRAIRSDAQFRHDLLGLASPDYYGYSVLDVNQINNMLSWPSDLAYLLTASALTNTGEFIDSDGYLADIDGWFEGNDEPFFTDLSQNIHSIFDGLDSTLLTTYTQALISTYVNLAYRQLLSAPELIDVDGLQNAMKAAGKEFSEELIGALRRMGNASISNGEWKIDLSAVSDIEMVSQYLTDINKQIIRDHDVLAEAYELPLISQNYLQSRYTQEEFSRWLEVKYLVVSDLHKFLIENADQPISIFQKNAATDLAEVAYTENWPAQAFSDMQSMMQLMYPRVLAGDEPRCMENNLLDQLNCFDLYSNVTDHFSIKIGKGYLAVYPSGEKPYVTNISTLMSINNILEQVRDLTSSLFPAADEYHDALEEGLWLSCDEDTLVDNIQDTKKLAEEYLSLVKADPSPSAFSDAYDKQDELKDSLIDLIKSCP